MSVHTDERGSHAVKQGGGGRNASQGGGAKSTRSGALGTHEIGVSDESLRDALLPMLHLWQESLRCKESDQPSVEK